MAERKSGPVKPPVIDLTARSADAPRSDTPPAAEAAPQAPVGATKPKEAASGAAAEPPKSTASSPPEASAGAGRSSVSGAGTPGGSTSPPGSRPQRSAWGPAAAGAGAGAVVAIAICYGLAASGLWPSARPDAAAQLTNLESRLATLEQAKAASADLTGRVDTLQSDIGTRLAATSKALDDVQKGLAALQQAKPATVDLAPLETEIKTLSSRLDAVAAGASSADAGAITANLATVEKSVADLSGRISALEGRAGTTEDNLKSLSAELSSAKATIDQAARAPSAQAIAAAMQLPLLISALEADFSAGRPYAADLASLTAARPETRVPASVSAAAAAGLPAPAALAQQLEAAVPDMLAARPAGTDTSWQANLASWFRDLLALRRQGEISGDSPDAVLSRLEAALDRHDVAAATTLFDSLPPTMQQAAGKLGEQLHAAADAEAFLADLRRTALTPAAGANP